MLININAYVEINPPVSTTDYQFEFNGSKIDHEIINKFTDDSTGGQIVECLMKVDADDPSKDNRLILIVNSISPQSFIQIRELFLDDIKMDHVLLLISELRTDKISAGTQLNSRGQIVMTFDMPVWSWWCENLHSIEVIENQGWKIRHYE